MKKNLLPIVLLLLPALAIGQKKPITLDDIYTKRSFIAGGVFGLKSMNDGKHYSSQLADKSKEDVYVLKYDYLSGSVKDTILKNSSLLFKGKSLKMDDYAFSNDESKVLVATETEQVYRRSFLVNNFVYDRKSKSLTAVSETGKQKYADFAPDASKIAFVRDNNIFIKDLNSGEEKKITTDGVKNKIINGGTDWVYEEEFEFARAFFWSPDGKKIAYYKFDETEVPEISIPVYNGLYPEEYRYKYPKAGEKNSIVSIHVYDLTTGSTTTVDVGAEKDQYIPRIKWTNDANTLCVFRMNRHQDKLEYLFANAQTGATKVVLTDNDKRYIDVNDDLTFLADNKSFLLTSEQDGFRHIYLYDMTGKLIRQVTKGNWEVISLYGIDEQSKTIYYQSTETAPAKRDIYAIKIDGTGKKKITSIEGTNNATFSTDFSYFINSYSNANTPAVFSLNDKNGKQLRVLEENKKLKEKLSGFVYQPKEFIEVPMPDGLKLNAWIIKPSNFDATKKYPVFMYAYGGPGSQQVLDSWNGGDIWFQTLADKGYIVFCMDNRGTGGRGADFKKVTYLQLGKYEIQDQIDAAKWLRTQSYVDASRIGYYGWSFGGYMASLAITRGADVFKMAIAGAPVTSWRYYDSIYTERFLRTPQENASGYDDNSPIHYAENLKGKFLLIHGTFDDNVHFQNSAEMALSLIKKNKQFDSFYYPNEHHGVRYRLQLQTMMMDFILKNL
ncbi:S9 family peptidase [Solitalea canadensis]|uniref:Dipeptidyl aminopeptidase/acylaminoacyl peptidase n=1 Tax=Solitalea canadensis (strain ATCC 29591 / DSM 3403 / JCM 21819 / LMG 8368 / NBRC 15130 / NCIMB 12057 / USAM 9D) TaxID=929556 RepID=H8KVM4_SOLCM|nr:S9 family peptidase [Solitalea canadensis]AFD06527.1 dipeptidyl aminopeptidase/acylaminoacyl peptidase [Solitalea canadensis DSM 3403]